MRLPDISVEMMRQAVRIYLENAYPQAELPEAVRERLDCLSAIDMESLLGSARIESGDACDGGVGRYTLRLGSPDYPHLKLVLERCSGCDEFIFSVDTHDRHFLFGDEVGADTRRRFEAIQERNAALKRAVESAWTRAGLPTFERYIHDGLAELRAASAAS